jgi:hypothetical protein
MGWKDRSGLDPLFTAKHNLNDDSNSDGQERFGSAEASHRRSEK